MNLRSPIVAMLWENWRLTRVEAALRTAVGLVAGAAALTFFDDGATKAFWILIVIHGMCVWFSTLKLNGGRFMDGYKPGFPFYLYYTRPLPTGVFVGAAMAYDAISCAALYLLSAALLGLAFGQPLPLFSVVVWIVTAHFAYHCVQWSTPSRAVQWVGSLAFFLPFFLLLQAREASPLLVEFSLAENALMILACVVTVVLTIAGVARQRRGDAVAGVPKQKAGSGGYPDWLINFFRFRCPTSSATRAQVWFELKSSGLPVLTIGLGVAMLIFLLYAVGISSAPARVAAQGITMFCLPVVLIALGGNAFGIRRKQGRMYASAFEATLPYGTAQMAGLKVLVRAACVLTALITISASVWASSSLIGAWGPWMLEGKDAVPGLLKFRQEVADAFRELTVFSHAALAAVASIAVAVVVAGQAAREALRARYPRGVIVGFWLVVLWVFAIVLLTLAGHVEIVPVSLGAALFKATFWISGAAMLLATIYLLWRGLAERVLTIRYACGALGVAAAFGAPVLAGMPAPPVAGLLWLVLGILMVMVLAPWTLSRVRHS